MPRKGYPTEFRRRALDLRAELVATKRKIAALETELAVHRRPAELLKEVTDPRGGPRRSR
jgi:transposase